MNLVDLRYSNAVYIYRTVCKRKMTVEEIAKETDMTPLTVNKILKLLLKCEFIAKSTDKSEKRPGRPSIYYEPGSRFYSALILNENGKMLLYYVSANGKITQDKKTVGFPENGIEAIMATVISNRIDKENPYYLGTYLLGDNIESFGEVKSTVKLKIDDFLAAAYCDEEKTVFIEYDGGQVLINHSKSKNVEISRSELEKIIDIDVNYDFRGKSQTEIIFDGMKALTQKLIERKI